MTTQVRGRTGWLVALIPTLLIAALSAAPALASAGTVGPTGAVTVASGLCTWPTC